MIRTQRWRQLSINLLVMLGSFVVIFVVFEFGVRVAVGGGYRRGKERRERATYTAFDPVLGWRLRPGAHAHYDRGEYTTDIAINSLGMRDRERSIVPNPGTFRILALGDSFVEGYTVGWEQTVGQVIERALNGPRCPIEVLNAGSGGYSTDQEYLFYRETGRRFGARVVLLFFYHNDLEPLLEKTYYGAPKPVFAYHQRSGLSLIADHIRERPPAVDTQQPPTSSGTPFTRSAAWGWLRFRLSVGAPRLYESLARWGLWEPLDRMPVYPELKAFHARPSSRVSAAWTVADQLLATLKREVEADGARLVVVYVPSRMEVDDADWDATCIQYGLLPERWSREVVARRLEGSGKRTGFPVLDLTPALRTANVAPFWKTYLVFDPHWNHRGHRAAGEAVAAYLRDARLLPDCALPR
jgi:hypothetical protein